ncbi:MAG TPA: hypothetical protein VII06_08645 [Chloroflexota bacterium]|jgi:hypothetical protein
MHVPASLLAPWIVVAPLLVFWVWMFDDMARNDHLTSHPKGTWFALFVLLNVFGAAWYYSVEYRNRH